MESFTDLALTGSWNIEPHEERKSSFDCNEIDIELYDLDDQGKRDEFRLLLNQRHNIDIDVVENGDVEDEEGNFQEEDDKVDGDVDPPAGLIRLRPSKFNMIPATIFVEYPRDLGLVRGDVSTLEPLNHKQMHFQCQWARNCIKNAFTRAGFTESNQNWTAIWAKHQSPAQLRGLNCLQKVNHFPGSWALGRKDRLSRTLRAMRRLHPAEFSFHPESFVLPADNHCLARCAKADVFHNRAASIKQKRLWIVKPVASSCGRGIRVISAEKALALGRKNERPLLVQRYLGDPYLINQKKFDLRLYVLVTGADPLRIYLHGEGLVRIATEDFSVKNLKNQFVHLTNYSINKKSKKFCASSKFNNFIGSGTGTSACPGKTESGHCCAEEAEDIAGAGTGAAGAAGGTNTDTDTDTDTDTGAGERAGANVHPGRDGYKWSLTAFQEWLAEQESPEVVRETMARVHALLVKTILAAEPDLSHSLHASTNYRTNCFELFGFDVLLDRQLQPHLLEVNVSPSLAGSSPLDNYIKGVLVADVCHVTGFHPHDEALLAKYSCQSQSHATGIPLSAPLFRLASTAGAVTDSDDDDKDSNHPDYANPFSFASLSLLMAGQDAWRRDMTMRNISMDCLGSGDAAWHLLLMVEDEFDRASASQFQRLHPTAESVDTYTTLYKNARFSDQLLGRWVQGGMSAGKENQKHLPARFRKEEEEEGAGGAQSQSQSPRGSGAALARARRMQSPGPRPGSAAPVPPSTSSLPRLSPFSNLRKNLSQNSLFSSPVPPVRLERRVFVADKVNRNEHTTVVFEPSSTKSSRHLGDMFQHLLLRNMRASSGGSRDRDRDRDSGVPPRNRSSSMGSSVTFGVGVGHVQNLSGGKAAADGRRLLAEPKRGGGTRTRAKSAGTRHTRPPHDASNY